MKITLLKGYLLSRTRQHTTACKKKKKKIGRHWKTDSWPNHIPLSAVRSSKPQLHMPRHTHTHTQTHTHTHYAHAHAHGYCMQTHAKNICPNTKIGPERLHLHLCPGPHLHTGVRMWHTHRQRKRDSREGGGKTRAGWITQLRSTKKLFLDIISLFWRATMSVIFIFK